MLPFKIVKWLMLQDRQFVELDVHVLHYVAQGEQVPAFSKKPYLQRHWLLNRYLERLLHDVHFDEIN